MKQCIQNHPSMDFRLKSESETMRRVTDFDPISVDRCAGTKLQNVPRVDPWSGACGLAQSSFFFSSSNGMLGIWLLDLIRHDQNRRYSEVESQVSLGACKLGPAGVTTTRKVVWAAPTADILQNNNLEHEEVSYGVNCPFKKFRWNHSR